MFSPSCLTYHWHMMILHDHSWTHNKNNMKNKSLCHWHINIHLLLPKFAGWTDLCARPSKHHPVLWSSSDTKLQLPCNRLVHMHTQLAKCCLFKICNQCLEFAKEGSLYRLLYQKKTAINMDQSLLWAKQIAEGRTYRCWAWTNAFTDTVLVIWQEWITCMSMGLSTGT